MKNKQKILIVGGNGFVGSTLARGLASEYEVICTYQTVFTPITGVQFIRGTRLDDKDMGKSLILKWEPQIVICTTGTNDLDRTEDDKYSKSVLMNHTAIPTNLNSASDSIKAKFIYISSDYVFSGPNGNFAEDDITVPSTQIGKAKLSSENYVRGRSLNHVVIRCAPLIGRGNLDHPSWVDHIRESLILGKSIKLPSRYLQNPVHISFLIAAVKESIIQEQKNKVLHVGGLSKVSPFECAQILAQFLKLNPALIQASDAESHSQINDYSLNFTQTLATLKLEPLLLEESLELLK